MLINPVAHLLAKPLSSRLGSTAQACIVHSLFRLNVLKWRWSALRDTSGFSHLTLAEWNICDLLVLQSTVISYSRNHFRYWRPWTFIIYPNSSRTHTPQTISLHRGVRSPFATAVRATTFTFLKMRFSLKESYFPDWTTIRTWAALSHSSTSMRAGKISLASNGFPYSHSQIFHLFFNGARF